VEELVEGEMGDVCGLGAGRAVDAVVRAGRLGWPTLS